MIFTTEEMIRISAEIMGWDFWTNDLSVYTKRVPWMARNNENTGLVLNEREIWTPNKNPANDATQLQRVREAFLEQNPDTYWKMENMIPGHPLLYTATVHINNNPAIIKEHENSNIAELTAICMAQKKKKEKKKHELYVKMHFNLSGHRVGNSSHIEEV